MNQQLFLFIAAPQQPPAEKEEELIRMRKVSHFTLSPKKFAMSLMHPYPFKKTVRHVLRVPWVAICASEFLRETHLVGFIKSLSTSL